MVKFFLSIHLEFSEPNFQNMSFLKVESFCCLCSCAQTHLTADTHALSLMHLATGIYVYTARFSIQSIYPQLHLEFEQTKPHAI